MQEIVSVIKGTQPIPNKHKGSIMSKPLTNAELLEAAPSIFSEAPIETASSQYHFLQTSSVLDTFQYFVL